MKSEWIGAAVFGGCLIAAVVGICAGAPRATRAPNHVQHARIAVVEEATDEILSIPTTAPDKVATAPVAVKTRRHAVVIAARPSGFGHMGSDRAARRH